MNNSIPSIEKRLCMSLGEAIKLHPVKEGLWSIATPFAFPDGDNYSLFLQEGTRGGWKLTDLAHTWMALSYDNDVTKFRQGNRAELMQQILQDSGVEDRDGELVVDVTTEDIGRGLLRLIQTVTRIHDLNFLNRERVEGTFTEDLQETLGKIVPFESLRPDFIVPDIPDGDKYPVDFRLAGKERQVFIFGVTGRDKARLVTIYLNHFLRNKVDFDSLCVLRQIGDVPKPDLARLMNVGQEMVASLDETEAISRKILRMTGT